jgi:hypothetical protein
MAILEDISSLVRTFLFPDEPLWKEVAREIHGEYDSGTRRILHRTSIGIASYSLEGRGGRKNRIYYYVMHTRFYGQQDFNFNIAKNYVWDEGLKSLLFKDLEVGDDELDKKFTIKGDDPRKLKQLLRTPAIKAALLLDLDSFEIVMQSDGLSRQLYYRSFLRLDKQQLKQVITLFECVANRLLEMGLVNTQLPAETQGGRAGLQHIAPPKIHGAGLITAITCIVMVLLFIYVLF